MPTTLHRHSDGWRNLALVRDAAHESQIPRTSGGRVIRRRDLIAGFGGVALAPVVTAFPGGRWPGCWRQTGGDPDELRAAQTAGGYAAVDVEGAEAYSLAEEAEVDFETEVAQLALAQRDDDATPAAG